MDKDEIMEQLYYRIVSKSNSIFNLLKVILSGYNAQTGRMSNDAVSILAEIRAIGLFYIHITNINDKLAGFPEEISFDVLINVIESEDGTEEKELIKRILSDGELQIVNKELDGTTIN